MRADVIEPHETLYRVAAIHPQMGKERTSKVLGWAMS
jgi:hypothetical protein